MAETRKVKLDAPIKRGDKEINEITLRRPQAGELRGLKVKDIMDHDVTTLSVLLPRISELTKGDVETLDLSDLFSIADEVTVFFAPQKVRKEVY